MINKEVEKELLNNVKRKLSSVISLDDELAIKLIEDIVFENATKFKIDFKDFENIIKSLFYKTRRRLGILQPLIEDNNVQEIMVNGPNNIFIDKNGIIEKIDMSFIDSNELEEVIQNIAGDVHREINELNPIVDCRLKDGSRVNGVYKNVAVNGPILTIRKFSDSYIKIEDLIQNDTISEEAAFLLENLVKAGYNIFISGGTSSGKTTLLNALAYSIPKNERVIVIEDSMELKLNSIENIVHMESKKGNSNGVGKVTMSDLIISSLRMRPDRIIVGEVRGNEVVPMLQAMNTGHNGSLSTGHANSVQGMLKRLETLYLSSLSIPVDAIRLQISEGIDIMVHIERLSTGKRCITEISEIVSYEQYAYDINKLFTFTEENGLEKTGNIIRNRRKIDLYGGKTKDELQRSGFID